MREKIIIISLIVSILLVVILAVFGLKIGNLQILSISQLIEKNRAVNEQIDKVSELTTIKYPEDIKKLDTTAESLRVQKEKYEQLSDFSNEDKSVYETEKYDISYLWTKLGKYATKNKVDLVMDIKKGVGTGIYNLNFTIQGEYVDISQFITTIENDSELLFRIYDFKLAPGGSDIRLRATFSVKDINIEEDSLNSGSDSVINLNNTNLSRKKDATDNSISEDE